MFDDPEGPIEHFSWGKFIVKGREHSGHRDSRTGGGKDIRVIGEEVAHWAERRGHSVTPDMITGVFGKDIEVLIIGVGVNGALEVPDIVKSAVRGEGIGELALVNTPEACRLYNEMFRQGRRVALLAHGTC